MVIFGVAPAPDLHVELDHPDPALARKNSAPHPAKKPQPLYCGPRAELKRDDVIWFPPGEKHWCTAPSRRPR